MKRRLLALTGTVRAPFPPPVATGRQTQHLRLAGLACLLSLLACWPSAAATRYVWQASPSPIPPYTNWVTAATNIQDAVNAAATGDEIVVTNGVYRGGVTVTNPLTLRSVNGPLVTVINGGGTNRCASLAAGASLTGLTLTNGSSIGRLGSGGGVWCASTNAFLTNCVITGNSAHVGGGAYGVALYNCTLSGNSAPGYPLIFNGQWVSYLPGGGGGAEFCILYNCTLTSNSANLGGGVYFCTLYNCTLSSNSVAGYWVPYLPPGWGEYYVPGAGGGAHGGTLYNCIVCSNTAANGTNYDTSSVLNFCCTTPMPTNGVGNITNEPAFVNAAAGDFHLQTNSPCINAGNNAFVTTATDLDGHPRVVSGTVDIGAYEYQGTGSVISYAWLQQNGLTTDGSADFTDPDHDGMNNWQEWICDTCPNNAASCLRLTIISNTPPVAVSFSSSAARLYTLLCCTNLTPSSVWTPVPGQSDMPGSGDVLTLTDANPPAAAFYRVSVGFP